MSARTYAAAGRPMLLAAKTLAPSYRVLRNRSHGRPITTIVIPMVQLPPSRGKQPHAPCRCTCISRQGQPFLKKKAGACAGGLGDNTRMSLAPTGTILLLMVMALWFFKKAGMPLAQRQSPAHVQHPSPQCDGRTKFHPCGGTWAPPGRCRTPMSARFYGWPAQPIQETFFHGFTQLIPWATRCNPFLRTGIPYGRLADTCVPLPSPALPR